jgi:hypothetical protein
MDSENLAQSIGGARRGGTAASLTLVTSDTQWIPRR